MSSQPVVKSIKMSFQPKDMSPSVTTFLELLQQQQQNAQQQSLSQWQISESRTVQMGKRVQWQLNSSPTTSLPALELQHQQLTSKQQLQHDEEFSNLQQPAIDFTSSSAAIHTSISNSARREKRATWVVKDKA